MAWSRLWFLLRYSFRCPIPYIVIAERTAYNR
uniref:Uncharacterized protein n=1 Tax=Strigamia maritima TaxID=126957 RepID=T1JPD5_STRMM